MLHQTKQIRFYLEVKFQMSKCSDKYHVLTQDHRYFSCHEYPRYYYRSSFLKLKQSKDLLTHGNRIHTDLRKIVFVIITLYYL